MLNENFTTTYSSSVIESYKMLKIEIITWERQCDDDDYDDGERPEGPDGVHIIWRTR